MRVRTLAGPKHSGQFGGAAPDALIVLLHALAALHDEHGDVVVPGLRREEWTGASYSDEEFRELAEIVPGVPFVGTGGLGERLWSGPAITVTGMDVLPVDASVNAVVPSARAKLSLRIHPAQDPAEAQAALVRHLESMRPFGIALEVEAAATGKGFFADTSGPAYDAARVALRGRLGGRVGLRRDRRVDSTGQRAQRGRAGGGDPALRHHRRVREHPRSQRARPARRVREGRSRRGRALRRSTPTRSPAARPRARHERHGSTASGRAVEGDGGAHPRRHRARREQDARPRDPLRLALPWA